MATKTTKKAKPVKKSAKALAPDLAEIRKLVGDKKEKFRKVSDDVWSTPELYFREYESAKTLIKALKEEGFKLEEGVADMPTAFVGSWGKGKPIIEGGNGHGCGHNALGAGAMAGAVAMKDYMQAHGLKGTVRYYGCPAEEAGCGKMFMAKAGLFDDVDAVFTWHPGSDNSVGSVSTLANQHIFFTFHGKAAHASGNPHLGRSALDACELMNVGANYLREHIIPEARLHYAYQDAGGPAPNVVQDYARLKYFVRAPKTAQVQEISERLQNVARGAALMTDTTLEIDISTGLSDMVPNDVLGNFLADNMKEVGAPVFDDADRALAKDFQKDYLPSYIENTLKGWSDNYDNTERFRGQALQEEVGYYKHSDNCMPGSTDVGDVSNVTPTAQFYYACYAIGTPAHAWQLTSQMASSITHKALVAAGELLALSGVRLLQDPALLQQAKAEFLQRTGGKKYIPPVDWDRKPEQFEQK